MVADILISLQQTIGQRMQEAKSNQSYVAQLNAQGVNKILEKIIEETGELILAAKDYHAQPSAQAKQEVIAELADTFFHTLVLLGNLDIDIQDIYQELARRNGISGITEKLQRKNTT